MSLDRECPKCGAEYDCRHGSQCPACGSFAATPCSVEKVGRQVIENKLLTALEDEGTVAAILNKYDLEVMIAALGKYRHRRAEQLAKDMQQLLDAAFH